MTNPRATVREINGELVLDDPVSEQVVRVIAKQNCRATADMQRDRIAHFTRRIVEMCIPEDDVLIVIVNMDDPFGCDVGEALMPGHDWQAYRDRGEVPFARGLAVRTGLQWFVDGIDPEVGEKLRPLKLPVVVFDHGTVEVFEAASLAVVG